MSRAIDRAFAERNRILSRTGKTFTKLFNDLNKVLNRTAPTFTKVFNARRKALNKVYEGKEERTSHKKSLRRLRD